MRLNHISSISILAGLLAALPLRGQNSIAVSCPGQAPAASSVDCAITLSLAASVSVDSLLFGLQVSANGNAPALTQGQLSFTDLIGGGFSATANTNNQISVLWATFSPALSGQQFLGVVSFTLPSSAAIAQTYAVTIAGASASLSNKSVSLTVGSPATVAVGVAFLSSVSPNTGQKGQTLASVAIAGQNSNFVQGTTVATFGIGITVNSLTVGGPTSATASITIAANAPIGPRDVSLTTGAEVATLDGAFTIAAGPLLSISKKHTGMFVLGQKGATYTITVSNGAAAGPASGTVMVTDTVPQGMTFESMSGTGWTCPGTAANNCTRSDSLAPGQSYPQITVTVNVAGGASTPLTNQASVAIGASAAISTNDQTTITTACDVGQYGTANVQDAQKIVNEALGHMSPTDDLNHDGIVDVVEVQLVINAVLWQSCPVS
jgi:uncharacterized repeat protein (TIGR01451 family)